MQKELSALEERLRPLQMRYEAEKKVLDEMRRLQQKRAELVQALELAEQRGDLARVADVSAV